MAKKRKVHPTIEPESATVHKPEKPQQQEEPQFEAEPEQQEEQVEEEPQAMEEENEDGAEDDDEDEKPEPNEGEEAVKTSEEANGGDNKNSENGGVDEGDLEDEHVEKLLEPFVKEQLVILVKEALAKYPELMENALKLAEADPTYRKIFVHSLGWETNTETLSRGRRRSKSHIPLSPVVLQIVLKRY